GNFIPYVPAALGKGRGSAMAAHRYGAGQLAPSVTWREAEAVRKQWDGPFVVKGVMTPADARAAAGIGATAIVVSNHGGRQMEGVPASIEALPAIAEALDGRLEIVLDGGVRRGTHVLKALALGAAAVMIGRPYLYGVTAGGQRGVARILAIFRAELTRDCQLLGVPSTAEVGPEQLAR
ncbi:MAG: alpha-hydroxy acid oxidase, partial [Dehalococcoidia bacterium]|nr:alpha-hydroxy acid oxidase [Dehalococcoidia bacterium]